MLCQAALSASHTKRGYLRDKFYRIKARRGHGRAVMAIADKILLAAYHMLRDGVPYRDLGDNYLDQRDQKRTVANLVTRIEALGYRVRLAPAPPQPVESSVSPPLQPVESSVSLPPPPVDSTASPPPRRLPRKRIQRLRNDSEALPAKKGVNPGEEFQSRVG